MVVDRSNRERPNGHRYVRGGIAVEIYIVIAVMVGEMKFKKVSAITNLTSGVVSSRTCT